MNAKPQIFLSSLPQLTDYVTIIAQVTSPGPHLLNCACCRALLRKSCNLLASPAINDKSQVYIVADKRDVTAKGFSDAVTGCNLKLVKVTDLTNNILQYCLDFTLHTYLYPSWTRVDNKYFQGKTCLFQNSWMGCVRAQVNVQSKSVILALKATLVKLVVAKLSSFHIRDDVIQKFMRKEITTINCGEMGDNTCYVLPSFKPALVHTISYEIGESCPLKDKSDMMAYWLDYHGMLIPSDTDIFVTLQFNFPGAPVMTYPYYCIRKSFPILKQMTDVASMNSFVGEVNSVLETKLGRLAMRFPVNPSLCTFPDKSNTCLTKTTPVSMPKLAVSRAPSPTNLKQQEESSGKESCNPCEKLKPRFTPYQRPNTPLFDTNRSEKEVPKIVPQFKSVSKPRISAEVPVSENNGDRHKKSSAVTSKPHQRSRESSTRSRPSSSRSICITPSKPPTPQTNVAVTPKPAWPDRKAATPRRSQPCSAKLSLKTVSTIDNYDNDDFDDFELPQSLRNYNLTPSQGSPIQVRVTTPKITTPNTMSTSQANPLSVTPTQKQKKSREPAKIMAEEDIVSMYHKGFISKVNNASLAAYLKAKNVRGVSKFKKEQLLNEVTKNLCEPLREP